VKTYEIETEELVKRVYRVSAESADEARAFFDDEMMHKDHTMYAYGDPRDGDEEITYVNEVK